jgi:hypothetical protein
MKPVYVINGFLESGKSEFISYTIAQPYFQSKATTLLILCEEGEVEYDPLVLKRARTVCEIIEDQEDFTPENLLALEKKHKPERIIIEWNGMWNFKEMRLPWHWAVEQQITTIDASTFQLYYMNMRSLLAEMIRKSELIMFNRCDGMEEQLPGFKRNVKAVNQQAEIVFEDAEGEMNVLFEEDLPYDLNADIIELDDMGYGVWFLDALDHPERYVGKTVKFIGMVARPEHFPRNYFVPGRLAMTCCEDDMAFLGFACEYKKAVSLKEKEWVEVTAVVEVKYWEDYKKEGPVLKAASVVGTKAPKDEVLSFV